MSAGLSGRATLTSCLSASALAYRIGAVVRVSKVSWPPTPGNLEGCIELAGIVSPARFDVGNHAVLKTQYDKGMFHALFGEPLCSLGVHPGHVPEAPAEVIDIMDSQVKDYSPLRA